MKITVIGDGAMGTLSAIIMAENGYDVALWSAFPEAAAVVAADRENKKFLPGSPLPENVTVTGDDAAALTGAELLISAVPTQFMRLVWGRLAAKVVKALPICSVAKGVENETLLRPTQVLLDVLDGDLNSRRAVASLSGPSIAPEVASRLPATVTAAATDQNLAATVQKIFNRPYFRVYTNSDLIGVEIAGATKNVIAIAAGILDGLKIGDNAKAALVARGLAEITRLGVAMGARTETFAGLAGLGDLVTTCVSPMGRNRSFGQAVGAGSSVQAALDASHGIVEGVATTRSIVQLAEKFRVDMPITQGVADVIFGGVAPATAIANLMNRPLKAE